jgi:1-deoxy-D-xylulose-5-phosphate reductoisomerase
MKKKIAIFGSTGSIGKNTLKVIANNPNSYDILALVANNNAKILIEQAKIAQPKFAVIANSKLYDKVVDGLKDFPQIKILHGIESVNEIAKIKCDLFICAIVGMQALRPTINAIRAGSNIGLANKECLVAAGDIMLKEAAENNIKLIPIDSEHNAIFQIFEHNNIKNIANITLTASGGPFFKLDASEMQNITKEQAIKHPKWSMGAKISVDSATMMNKALEIIEAYRLFPISCDQIKVVIHPESIIHGLVNYDDGSTLAMMSLPDMQVPISYAIGYPKRIKIRHQYLDLAKIGALNFYEADADKFPSLKLARDVLEIGKNAPCILNAANEVAVSRFLQDEIAFMDIFKINMEVLKMMNYNNINSLEDVMLFDRQAREIAFNLFKKDNGITISN